MTSKRLTAADKAAAAEREADTAEFHATFAERQRLAHDRTIAATARLTAAAAGLDPERLIHVQHQDAVDGAIEDAFFVLLSSLRGLHIDPLRRALSRAGYVVAPFHTHGADGELLKTFAEFEAAELVFAAAPESEKGRAADARVTATATKITAMQAKTFPGLIAKLKVLANDADTLAGADWTEDLVRGLVADAEAMQGRVAA
ncbi:MAG: hypothetical protein WCJ64_18815 [Rhodospirillaceae bacterium]